jgi:hypothetical protein
MLKQKSAFNVVARQRQTSELRLKDKEALASKRDKDTPFDGDFQRLNSTVWGTCSHYRCGEKV